MCSVAETSAYRLRSRREIVVELVIRRVSRNEEIGREAPSEAG